MIKRTGTRAANSVQVCESWHWHTDRVAEIVGRARREHPYEVPGVSARPIIDGNPDYLAWIAKETSTPGGWTHRPTV